ncbi:MAG: glycosyltransferase family 4 protein [Terriglobia bacterium]
MKIALDIRRIQDYGAGTHTRNLVLQLARLDPSHRYYLIGTEADYAELGPLPENFSLLACNRSDGRLRYLWRVSWQLKQQKVELCHIPYLAAPWWLPCPYMVTVHDLVDFILPVEDRSRLEVSWRFYRMGRALQRARRVLCVSRTTERDVQRVFGVPASKVEVVYNALDERLAGTLNPEEIDRTLARYQAEAPFLLYAGNVKSHKNLSRLIEAFALVKDEWRTHPRYQHLRLFIIGDELSKHSDLRRAVVKSRTQADVRFLGFVPPQTLKAFYTRAEAFVFPSLYEGFGLPPLEAMAHGTPVVASNVSALPEVVGDAALLVNPENVFDINRAIRQLLLDGELRAQLVTRGYKRVQRFSWEASVRRVLHLYEEVLAPAASVSTLNSPTFPP